MYKYRIDEIGKGGDRAREMVIQIWRAANRVNY
jgi:hypothetical protein